jgi:hypothetical protein
MRPILTAMSLRGALYILAIAIPSTILSAEPSDHDHTHAEAPSGNKVDRAAAGDVMQQMQAMHEKMMAAKTPAERQALMADHMKAMQQGMTMMQQMTSQSGKGPMPSQMMSMRMDMMTMMMQMMMDRQQVGGMSMGGMSMGATPSTPNPTAPPK